jgi:DNA-binding GntR family transcriptional regulator
MLNSLAGPLPKAKLARLKAHYKAEQAAIADTDPGDRSYLLGDFHVCLAECVSGPLLADILRDLTARTTLVATLFQSTHDAALSCSEHVAIVAALEQGDAAGAAELMRAHIVAVAAALGSPAPQADPLDPLRQALHAPASAEAATTRGSRRLFNDLLSADPSPTPTPTATRAPNRATRRIE